MQECSVIYGLVYSLQCLDSQGRIQAGRGGGGGGGGGRVAAPLLFKILFFLHAVLRLPPTPLVESAEDGQPFPYSLNIGLFLILLIGLP